MDEAGGDQVRVDQADALAVELARFRQRPDFADLRDAHVR